MKYLKTFESLDPTRIESQIEQIKELFVDLEDRGFIVIVQYCDFKPLDFSKGNTMNGIEAEQYFKSHWFDTKKSIYVRIKRASTTFDLNEIVENLKFVESYAREELGLNLEYISTQDRMDVKSVGVYRDNNYYKSADDVERISIINDRVNKKVETKIEFVRIYFT